MEFIAIQGKTVIDCEAEVGTHLTISIYSYRCASLAIHLSRQGKWRNPIFPYATPWVSHDFFVFGFQPKTGCHVVVKR